MTDTQTNIFTFDHNETNKILDMKNKARILFEGLRLNDIFKNNVVIAGGCFTSWYHGEHPKDYDIFVIGNLEEQAKVQNVFESMLVGLVDVTQDYKRDNDKIIGVWQDKNQKQIIYTHYKTREELIQHFDFTHCMVSYYADKIHLTRKTFDAIVKKHLIPNQKSRIAEWRVEKFKSRGFTFPHEVTFAPPTQRSIPLGNPYAPYVPSLKPNPYTPYVSSLNPFKNGMARVNPMRSAPLPQEIEDWLDGEGL